MKRTLIALLSTLLIAVPALAQHHGNAPGHPPGFAPDPRMDAGHLLVAPDGTVFVVANTEVKAINAAGATIWTAATPGRLVLSGSNLLSIHDSSTSSSISTTITAIATATGATAWTRAFDGRVMELEPFSGGTYAVVIVPPAAQGGTATRSLVAISNSGAVLWTAAL